MTAQAHQAIQANGKAVRAKQRKPKHNINPNKHKVGEVHLAKHYLKPEKHHG